MVPRARFNFNAGQKTSDQQYLKTLFVNKIHIGLINKQIVYR